MINFKSLIRHFTFYFIINIIGLGLFAYLEYSIRLSSGAFADQEILDRINDVGHIELSLITVLLFSSLLALVTSLVDTFLFKRLHLRLPFGILILIEIIVQLIIVYVVWIFVLTFVWHAVLGVPHAPDEAHDYSNYSFILILLFFLIGLGRLVIATDRKLGHGNIWKLITGRFYNPIEDERVFMFIDLKDSAKIAEQLGHIKFSRFIKSCFSDLSIVDNYRAEIYQFVGDEVVLTWCKKNAFKNNNYLNAFYAFKTELLKRRDYYIKTFGVQPFFKAGVHAGLVVTTEVGDLKREICYHGDTINTAARIQGLCNAYDAELLISNEVYKLTENKTGHLFIDQGKVDLKGKDEDAHVFKIEL